MHAVPGRQGIDHAERGPKFPSPPTVAGSSRKSSGNKKVKNSKSKIPAPLNSTGSGGLKKSSPLGEKEIQRLPPQVVDVLKKAPPGARISSIKVKVGDATYKIIMPEPAAATEKLGTAEEKNTSKAIKWLGRTIRCLSSTGLVVIAVSSALKQGGIMLGISLPVFQKWLGLTQFSALGYGLVATGAIIWGSANIFGQKIESGTATTLAYGLLSFALTMLEVPTADKAEGA